MSNIVIEASPRLTIPKNNEIVVKDAKDILAEHKNDPRAALEQLKANAKAYRYEPEKKRDEADILFSSIITADAFMRSNIPKPTEVIDGVLYKGDKMCLNASSKIGKTWHLLKLGLSVSEGLPWLGKNTTKSKVLFINFELQDHVIQQRVKMIKNDICANTDANNFYLLNMRGIDMRSEKFVSILPKLGDKLKDQGYGMIIFDPIYKLYGFKMDENAASDVALLLNHLEEMARKTGASIVYSHHFAKGGQAGKSSIDRASGSGVFARDPDAIVNITALEDNDDNSSFVVDMQLRCFKPVKPFGIRIVNGSIVMDSSLNLNNIKKPGQFKQVYSERDILKILSVQPYTTGDLLTAVKEATGMGSSKFYELFRTVKKLPGVTADKDKRWSYIVPASNPSLN